MRSAVALLADLRDRSSTSLAQAAGGCPSPSPPRSNSGDDHVLGEVAGLQTGQGALPQDLDVLGRQHAHLAVPRPRMGVAFDAVAGDEAPPAAAVSSRPLPAPGRWPQPCPRVVPLSPMPGLAAALLQQPHRADLHSLAGRLDHVVHRQGGHRHGRHGLHLHARLASQHTRASSRTRSSTSVAPTRWPPEPAGDTSGSTRWCAWRPGCPPFGPSPARCPWPRHPSGATGPRCPRRRPPRLPPAPFAPSGPSPSR